ncbi:hypothetical protein [Streptomyces sp. NPDC055749]
MSGRVLAERYQLSDELGRGTTGVLWRGWDKRAGGAVAVRVLPPAYGEPDAHARLSAASRTLGKVQDRRVVDRVHVRARLYVLGVLILLPRHESGSAEP